MHSPIKVSRLILWALIVTMAVSSVSSRVPQAQTDRSTPQTSPNSQKEKEAEELQKKTLVLLNDLVSASWSLKLPENRLFIMSGAADLLWAVDQKRARAVYWDALNALNLISSSVKSTEQNLSRQERMKIFARYLAAFELRQKLLRQVAKRDAQLALEMLRASRQVPPRVLGSEFTFPEDAQLEQAIATEFAARDPAQALQIARQSLAKGLTLEVVNLLQRLNDIDSDKGSQFAGELIAKIRTRNLASDFHGSIIAVELLEDSRALVPKTQVRFAASLGRAETLGGTTRNALTSATRKVLTLTDEQKRDLVETLTNAALSATVMPSVISQVARIMPEIEEFFPERQAGVTKKLASLNRRTNQPDGEQNSLGSGMPANTPEELVRLGGAGDTPTLLAMYYQAAILAVAQGKTDWLRDEINKQILNNDDRAKIIDYLDSQEIFIAAYRKEVDRLQKLLPKIRRQEERARAMVALSLMLKENGKDEEAAAMLDEAATMIKTDLTDEKQTNALFTLLCAYAIVDPPKAFALAERTVDKANSQISLLLLLDKVVKSGAVKKNEIVLEQPGLVTVDFLMFQYGKGVAALAKTDFSRTRALTERFERNELRLMAQLLLLKGLLEPPAL
jgi:hypothetical protein